MHYRDDAENKRFQWGSYSSKRRWSSYWHQIDEGLAVNPRNCLIIGHGDGIVADVIAKYGVKMCSLDISGDLRPDVVGDVTAVPLLAKHYDVTICCQVLEHIEYRRVPQALKELARITRLRVVLSVPDKSRSVDFSFRVSSLRFFRRIHLPSRRWHSFDGKHYWELGTLSTPARDFRLLLERYFTIEKEFQVQEYAYHHFFVLAPSE